MTNDLSANTAVITFVIALVGWGLKSSVTSLIKFLAETIKKMGAMELQIAAAIAAMDKIQKLEIDINNNFSRLRLLEKNIQDIQERVQ
jgi:predicted  nucleic acid-binding Zn-ribbon protein